MLKFGSGAFMKKIEDARNLSQKMVNIGKLAKKDTMAIITNMDVPLGHNRCIKWKRTKRFIRGFNSNSNSYGYVM